MEYTVPIIIKLSNMLGKDSCLIRCMFTVHSLLAGFNNNTQMPLYSKLISFNEISWERSTENARIKNVGTSKYKDG